MFDTSNWGMFNRVMAKISSKMKAIYKEDQGDEVDADGIELYTNPLRDFNNVDRAAKDAEIASLRKHASEMEGTVQDLTKNLRNEKSKARGRSINIKGKQGHRTKKQFGQTKVGGRALALSVPDIDESTPYNV